MLDRVLIAARGAGGPVLRRIDALAAWYGVRADVRPVAGGSVTIAVLGAPLHSPTFGEPPPATLDLIGADERALRRYEGGGAAVASTPDRARIVAGAGAPALLYAAEGGVAAWSTHAVAASYVATGSAAVDPPAIAEQLAAEFVGDGRSLVAGVRALDAASCVDLTATRAEEWCYWPARDRWRLVPEEDAHAYAEMHLLQALKARLAGVAHPLIGLTAGYDSRVAALALREIGLSFEGYTWGPPQDDDVIGGAQAARALGMEHRHLAFEQWDGAEALRQTRANARWTEGAIHVGFAGILWPQDMRAFVTGAGGETGRCFYYADRAGEPPPADPDALARIVSEPMADRIAGARPDRIDALHERVRDWVADAERAGVSGWRALDVVYAEQRVRRWLRGMLPQLPAPMVGAFTAPEVQRGLVSLPISERTTSGFHRRFILDRRPELMPETPRQAAAAGRRPLARVARRLRGGALDGEWTSRPEYRDWIADAVLGGPLAVEAMGERWCRRVRSRFYAGDAVAVERALWLGGMVALSEALSELGRQATVDSRQ